MVYDKLKKNNHDVHCALKALLTCHELVQKFIRRLLSSVSHLYSLVLFVYHPVLETL